MSYEKGAHIRGKLRADGRCHVPGSCDLVELGVLQNSLKLVEGAGIVVPTVDDKRGHDVVFQVVAVHFQITVAQPHSG